MSKVRKTINTARASELCRCARVLPGTPTCLLPQVKDVPGVYRIIGPIERIFVVITNQKLRLFVSRTSVDLLAKVVASTDQVRVRLTNYPIPKHVIV
jgi:hypothetical protein